MAKYLELSAKTQVKAPAQLDPGKKGEKPKGGK